MAHEENNILAQNKLSLLHYYKHINQPLFVL